MSFAWPFMLPLLAIVPLAVAAYVVLEQRRTPYAVRFTNIETLAAAARGPSPWRRWIPPALFFLALAFLLAALARPEIAVTSQRREGNIILAIDSSGSMFAKDVEPTRLGAAQEAVRRFLDRLPSRYRVGVVTFSEEAQVVAPVTSDRQVVLDAVEFLYPGRGTAIGDGLARSVELAQDAEALDAEADAGPGALPSGSEPGQPVTAILLLSDGSQTQGILQPSEGAQRATAAHIPVYTVALGTPDGTVTFERFGVSRTIQVPPDPVTLEQIAQATNGEFFAAATGDRLNSVYERLGSRLGRYRDERESTDFLIAAGAVLLVGAGLLGGLLHPRLP